MNSDHRDILVICETRAGRSGAALAKSALETLTKARELADNLGARVEALILGHGVAELGEVAIHAGADVVLLADDDALTVGAVDAHFHVALPVVKERKPEIVLMSATPLGLDLAPRLGAALGTGALSDATKLEIDTEARLLVAKRLTYDGSIEAVATIPRARPQIASLRPGAVRPGFPDDTRYGSVENVEVKMPAAAKRVRFLGLEDAPEREPELHAAEIVVTGGLGLGKDGFVQVKDLAHALGGTWGASRAAVHFGLAPAERQVGATGTHVRPKIYVACGVSGAFEHVVGMADSELVVALNPDKTAAIFKRSHYGLVGDAKEVIPKILEELKRD